MSVRFSLAACLGGLLCGLLGTGNAVAQAPSWGLYNAGNAPIANDIREIRQQGSAMWVLGPTALYRQQAGQWTTFTLPGTYANGFPVGGRALHVDGQGNKWIGTSEETLRLDAQGSFSLAAAGAGPTLNYDDDIVADQVGNLFFVSAFNGVYRYDGTTLSYVLGGGSGGLRRMIIDGSTYWFTGAVTLVRYDGGLTRSWYLNPSVFFSDLRRWNGLIWVASEQGLQRFSPTTTQFQPALTPANSPLPSRYVNCLLVDSRNGLWAGTQQGLARYDGANWDVFTMANSPLPANDVRTLFEDSFGNLWIGTATGGLAVYHAGGILGTAEATAGAPRPSFTVAPNPSATGRFRCADLGTETVSYEVVDAVGRAVSRGQLTATAPDLDLSAQPAGLYLLRGEAQGKTLCRRLVRE